MCRELRETYDIEIGAGAGAYASSVWRIGLMAPTPAPMRCCSCLPPRRT